MKMMDKKSLVAAALTVAGLMLAPAVASAQNDPKAAAKAAAAKAKAAAKEKAVEQAKEEAKAKSEERAEAVQKKVEKKVAANKAANEEAAKAEAETHSKHMGMIERLEQIATATNNAELTATVARLKEKETKRHQLAAPPAK